MEPEKRSNIHAEWEKQKMITMYGVNELSGDALLPYIVPEITRVVDTVTGRTALVHQIIKKYGVQVWVKERGQERENWPWRIITVRQPRRLKRYPRPFRWPREEETKQCHCLIGKMEVENAEERAVRCTRCKNLIGSESYPRRIERATDAIRKESNGKKPRPSIRKRVLGRAKRKASRKSKIPVKARERTQRKSAGRVDVRPKRRNNAKAGNRASRARTIVSKVHKAIPSRAKVSKVQTKSRNKARTAKGKVGRGK